LALQKVVICDGCKKKIAIGKCYFCKGDMCEDCAITLLVNREGTREGSDSIKLSVIDNRQSPGPTFAKMVVKGIGFCSHCWDERINFLSKLTFGGRCNLTQEMLILLNKFSVAENI